MIVFACPRCFLVMKSRDNWAGTKGKCPHCGQRIMVPKGVRPILPANGTALGSPVPIAEPSEPLQEALPPVAKPPKVELPETTLYTEPETTLYVDVEAPEVIESPEPRVRCHRCGCRVRESRAKRRTAKTASFEGGATDTHGLGYFLGATYSRVDLCPECAEQIDQKRMVLRSLGLVLAIFGIIAFALLMMR